MFVTITGGASSGKSQLGEECARIFGGALLYLATMEPFGEEGKKRVERHRRLRQAKGFETLEVYRNLSEAFSSPAVQKADTVLLECMLNLLANESFPPRGSLTKRDKEDLLPRLERDILALKELAPNLVVITGEVFSDGISYPLETEEYIRNLGALNRFLVRESDVAIKAVAGLPVVLKGDASIVRRFDSF